MELNQRVCNQLEVKIIQNISDALTKVTDTERAAKRTGGPQTFYLRGPSNLISHYSYTVRSAYCE